MQDLSTTILYETASREEDDRLISVVIKHAISATISNKGTIADAIFDNGVKLSISKGHHGYHLFLIDESLYLEGESSETTLSYERLLLRLTELTYEKINI